jgi:hypothetical protein
MVVPSNAPTVFSSKYMPRILQRVFLISGITMLIDVAFFGPGLILPVVGVSLRRTLFVVILVALGFRRVMRDHTFTNDEVAFVALLLAFGLFWGALIPYSYGYSLSQSFADISPWLGLVTLALWPWDAWPEETQWNTFCKFLVAVALLLAVAHLGIWTLLVSNLISPELFAIGANLILSNADGESFLRIVPLEGGQYRVFWSSSIFLLGGIYFLSVSRQRSMRKLWAIEIALACLALATTYIRGFLASIVIFALLAVVLRRFYRLRRVRSPISMILGFWIASVVSVSVAINPAVLASLGLSRDASDVERIAQSTALLARFDAHPLLGSGFGSYASQVIRATETPFSYELVFYALLMKLGLVGLCALILILVLGLRVAFARKLATRRPNSFAIWLAFTTGLWFAGATNPSVTNFVGMTIVVLLFVDMRIRSSAPSNVQADG